jgi:hypothetical protein
MPRRYRGKGHPAAHRQQAVRGITAEDPRSVIWC